MRFLVTLCPPIMKIMWGRDHDKLNTAVLRSALSSLCVFKSEGADKSLAL
jgi:hypothetical protein